ncbi:MAG: F0F1 ATP synthase subunit A [Flavobacterium sp.]|nr:F0F1 ATP synthase subunit A [Flavobacterium sp.]
MVFSKKSLHLIIVALVAFLPLLVNANETNTFPVKTEQLSVEDKEQAEKQEKIDEVINHHVLDGHSFIFFSSADEKEHYGFSLPVIIWDNGFHVFSSSNFNNEKSLTFVDGNYYKLHHEQIYKTDFSGKITEVDESPTNEKVLDLSITKGVLSMLIVAILMFTLFTSLAQSFNKNGGIAKGAGRFFEPIVLYVRDEIAIPNIGEKHYKKYMSHLLTIFFFVWFLNIFGLMPFGINVTGNIAITAGLALVTYLITTFTANKNYWGHIFWMPGVPVPMKIILIPIELLGTIIKPFSLMIRLYANIFAGHIVLMSLVALMFIFKSWLGSSLSFMLSFAISIIEILVALLQAYIFTMLSALYFGSAVEEHHHEEAH